MSSLLSSEGAPSFLPDDLVTQQFLTMTLSKELYALPIGHIREIIEYRTLTEIPLMPLFLRGVINLRGAVVPVVDISVRFGRERTAIGRRTCIVITEVEQQESIQMLGILVDAVNEVLAVEPEQVEPRPAFGTGLRADFIAGIINLNERFVIVLDTRQVLSVEEISELVAITSADR